MVAMLGPEPRGVACSFIPYHTVPVAQGYKARCHSEEPRNVPEPESEFSDPCGGGDREEVTLVCSAVAANRELASRASIAGAANL